MTIKARMARRFTLDSRLHQLAMGLSGLCAVHCVATVILLGLLASAGGMLGKPIIHEVGLSLAMVIGAVALGRGVREHGFLLPSAVGAVGLAIMAYAMTLHETGFEPAFTIVGVLALAVGRKRKIESKTQAF